MSSCFSESGVEAIECSVCLQTCIHPVQLPCSHIFCYLCVKGVAHRSKRCALCRMEIPLDFFNNPILINKDELLNTRAFDECYQWFYEGRNGWWQYDDRTSTELEEKHKKGEKIFELLIAGFLYVIDFDNMIQYRRNDNTRKRRVKRDLVTMPGKKGVAGLIVPSIDPSRPGVYGEEIAQYSARHLPQGEQINDDTISSPPPPSNTPQTPDDSPPHTAGGPHEQELSSRLETLSLHEHGRPRSRHTSPKNGPPAASK